MYQAVLNQFFSRGLMSACPKVVLNKLLVVDELEQFVREIDSLSDEWNRMQFEQEMWEYHFGTGVT